MGSACRPTGADSMGARVACNRKHSLRGILFGLWRAWSSEPMCKVVFSLPNGSAIVLMKPESHADGSLSLTSSGDGFGDPGFYFVVHGEGSTIWARYVRTMRERITVYPAERGTARADHVLYFWGKEFLRLHYRMRAAGNEQVGR